MCWELDRVSFIHRILPLRVSADRRELLWDRRHYLYDEPSALPRVLLAAHSWEWACLPDLHAMVAGWGELPPVDAIQLLLPR